MIYIDELMLLNFIIDYVILSTLTFLLKKNVKKRRYSAKNRYKARKITKNHEWF